MIPPPKPPEIASNFRPNFWKARVLAPIAAQLRQGISPKKIALTIAFGFVLGMFPILGATTLLCTVAGFALRLNQPIIQVVNYVSYPIQLLSILPFYRAGETLFRQPHVPLSLPLLFARFRTDSIQFIRDFGRIALQGIAVWMLVAPALAAVIFLVLRPILERAESRLRASPRDEI